jgi:lysozyme
MNRKPVFDLLRALKREWTRDPDALLHTDEVIRMDNAITSAENGGTATGGIQTAAGALATPHGAEIKPLGQARGLSDAGIALIQSFEQCRLDAYPDPGSADGNPWTVGWGSTGSDIKRGTVWTRAQADQRFKEDIKRYEKGVNEALGDSPTTQAQYDALTSLAYNIGIRAAAGSTVMHRHKAGDYEGAAAAFAMWNKNDGKVMLGLVRRRAAEAKLYRGQA